MLVGFVQEKSQKLGTLEHSKKHSADVWVLIKGARKLQLPGGFIDVPIHRPQTLT
jgi:hypothetical protein